MASSLITRDRIVEEAVALMRSGGLEAVSLRALAARLGVKAPSLYWHVDSKERLQDLMSQAIFRSCLEAVPGCRDWRDWLRAFGLAIWRAQTAMPDIRRLIGRTSPDPVARRLFLGEIVERLTALGLDAGTAAVAQRSVQALVTGWTTLPQGGGGDEAAAERVFRDALDALIEGWSARVGADRT